MTVKPTPKNDRYPTTAEFTAAIRLGVSDALHRRRSMGLPIVVWENGQIVWKQPDRGTAKGDEVSIVAAIAGG